MRLTVITLDDIIVIDGVGKKVNLSNIDQSYHAIQWYDTYGEIEIKDPITQKMVENRVIDSIEFLEPFITLWENADAT